MPFKKSGIEISEVENRRKLAIAKLSMVSEHWGKSYLLADYALDKTLREILGLPEKSLGKPPYEWVETKLQ